METTYRECRADGADVVVTAVPIGRCVVIQTRESTYRGQRGWLVSGVPQGRSHKVSIFFEHESAARRVAVQLKADPDFQTTMADFEPAARVCVQ